jgi:ABC-2 type transport system permease protein
MRAVRTLSWIELKLFLREPITVVFTLALPPIVLYVLAEVFGNVPDPTGQVYRGVGPITFYTPAYVGLVIASLGLIGLPVHLAAYRERGVLRRFRAVRMPVRALLMSQLFVLLTGTLAGAAIIIALARTSYGVDWPRSWLGVAFATLVGALSFAALGAFIGLAMPTARAAQGTGVLLWFVMMMVSGSGPPPEVLGSTLGRVGDVMPLRHLVIALQDPWLGHGVNWFAILVLTAILGLAAALAVPAVRRRT